MSAVFNFQSLLTVLLLLICVCTYLRSYWPDLINRNKTGCLPMLKKFGITTVINLTDKEFEYPHKDKVTYHGFDLEDEAECDVSEYYDKLFAILAGVKEKNGKALLCDLAGTSLPSTMMAAYMLQASKKQEKYLPLSKALAHIASKDPVLKPSEHMLLRLCLLEEDLYEECSVSLSRPGGARGKGGRGGKGKRGK